MSKSKPYLTPLWPCPGCYTEWSYPCCENRCDVEIPHGSGYIWPTSESTGADWAETNAKLARLREQGVGQ